MRSIVIIAALLIATPAIAQRYDRRSSDEDLELYDMRTRQMQQQYEMNEQRIRQQNEMRRMQREIQDQQLQLDIQRQQQLDFWHSHGR